MPRLPKVSPPSSALVLAAAPPRIFIGTSGWAYPTWKPGFYPDGLSSKKFLSFYASQLNSVEVNFTFRKLPSPAALADWIATTPPGFRFTFKAPQRITHFQRLRDCEATLSEFLTALEPVRKAGKLGLILFQLPPNFKADPDRLAAFLTLPALCKRTTPPIAFEFRHESWFSPAIEAVLRKRKAALCIAESDDLATPELHPAPAHTSFRLRRNGGYSPTELAAFARRFITLSATRDVYIYLKHEDAPTGALNATALLQLALSAGSAS